MSLGDIPIGVWVVMAGALGGALVGVLRVPYVVRRNNRQAERIYEDSADWVRRETGSHTRALADRRDEEIRRGFRDDGSLARDIGEIQRTYAERWRSQQKDAERAIQDLEDSENGLHRLWRKLSRSPWPEDRYAEEIAPLVERWE
jgi:hypothetical protein